MVLPFANLSGDAAHEYFSDAITDEITTEVARLASSHLAVIARTTARRYKATRRDAARIGRELGVDDIVEGGVRHAEGRILVDVQLIHAAHQTHVWVTAESLARAREHLERAIQRDPGSRSLTMPSQRSTGMWGTLDSLRRRRPSRPGCCSPCARSSSTAPWRKRMPCSASTTSSSTSTGRRSRGKWALALRLNPSSPLVRARYAANLLMPRGRLEEAVQELERALELDPLSTATRGYLAVMLLLSRQHERARDQARTDAPANPPSGSPPASSHSERKRIPPNDGSGIGKAAETRTKAVVEENFWLPSRQFATEMPQKRQSSWRKNCVRARARMPKVNHGPSVLSQDRAFSFDLVVRSAWRSRAAEGLVCQ